MRVFVTREQLAAIHHTRHTRSPGGTAAVLGMTRQGVMWRVDKGKDGGFLAWVCREGKDHRGREYHSLYVDLGPWGENEALHKADPTEWRGRDPWEIIQESMQEYAENWARRVAAGEHGG